MKFKVDNNWGIIELEFEDGSKSKPRGQLVSYNGVVGRLWSISDVSSHNAGHGMGSMTSSQAIIVTKDMEVVKVKNQWGKVYELEMLGEYTK